MYTIISNIFRKASIVICLSLLLFGCSGGGNGGGGANPPGVFEEGIQPEWEPSVESYAPFVLHKPLTDAQRSDYAKKLYALCKDWVDADNGNAANPNEIDDCYSDEDVFNSHATLMHNIPTTEAYAVMATPKDIDSAERLAKDNHYLLLVDAENIKIIGVPTDFQPLDYSKFPELPREVRMNIAAAGYTKSYDSSLETGEAERFYNYWFAELIRADYTDHTNGDNRLICKEVRNVDAEAAASYECWILNLHSSDELALFFAKVDSNSFEEIKSFILDNFM